MTGTGELSFLESNSDFKTGHEAPEFLNGCCFAALFKGSQVTVVGRPEPTLWRRWAGR